MIASVEADGLALVASCLRLVDLLGRRGRVESVTQLCEARVLLRRPLLERAQPQELGVLDSVPRESLLLLEPGEFRGDDSRVG